MVIPLTGTITAMTVTAAHADERDAADDRLSAIAGLLIGDKGNILQQFKTDWFLRLLQRVRNRVDTVIGQLEQRFGLALIRVRDPWHLTNRVARKILAHTFAVSLNRCLGREPLQFDGLVTN